ncbi:hypothetical protein [Croceitalea rosinachiae]|uniref:Uncharacterized protein n=1 Tax=Croceitalea rosinachiae TaxID=3075596 RepID=A0ABU3ACX6_9FLAO|nr:hypothetical protein [Croceitalea sp. F388]MDT0608031.1 hypothetical protein [Croceitalea sp. F388]
MKTKMSKKNGLVVFENFIRHSIICDGLNNIVGDCSELEPDYIPLVDAVFNTNLVEGTNPELQKYYELLKSAQLMNASVYEKAKLLYENLKLYTSNIKID